MESIKTGMFSTRPSRSSGRDLDEVYEAVRQALSRLDIRPVRTEIGRDTSIVDELGFDSVRMVELTVALEDALGIAEFPLQDWYDSERELEGKHFTVESLALACLSCLEERP